ncbi:MAG: class I SAM-dependent methyltransferase [Planctomycetota bacterium]|nr:class I SAM-dependent methyltransferase [Planctomycetota bacterium]
MDTDWDWERFGEKDPYWAVITHEKYRQPNLSAAVVQEFYETGESQVDWLFETVRRFVRPDFAPVSALDFGCGVGRLTIPLAKKCKAVVGVDVSTGMLRKAQERCDQIGIKNITLVKGDDDLSQVGNKFDLIASYIVLQHIPVDRGLRLFCRLVDSLNDGGVGALHLTYSRADSGPDLVRAESARMLGSGQRSAEPVMQMNGYDLNWLFHILQASGVRRMHTEFSDHGGPLGVMLMFCKGAGQGYSI